MPAVEIIHENADLLVLAKPPGLETVSQTGGADFLSLAREARGEPALAAVHRLDRDTSGALLVARTAAAEKKLTDLFRRRAVEKTYLALCLGRPRNASGTINRRLSEWGGGHRPVKILKQGGLEASTGYSTLSTSEWLAEDFRVSLIEFRPHQGRTHQIRVHAAALGYPVLGDDQYGDRAANKLAKHLLGLRRQALHSARLRFEWEGAGGAIGGGAGRNTGGNAGEINAFCPFAADMRGAAEAVRLGGGWRGA